MPRIRTIKPEFWSNDKLSDLSLESHAFAAGLLNHCDDEGWFNANPKLIGVQIFPVREEYRNCTVHLQELSNIGFVTIHNGTDGRVYGHVTKFKENQVINKPKPSKIKDLVSIQYEYRTNTVLVQHGKERKGKESNPPTPLIQDSAEPKKDDDDDFLKKAKARFGEENLRQAEIQYKNKIKEEIDFYKKESKRVLEIAKDHMAGFIDLTSPAIHEPKEFYEMLKMGYTAKEIGVVIENLIQKQTDAGNNLSIKSWAYVKTAVMNFYKDKI
jgi:hypothetical protein